MHSTYKSGECFSVERRRNLIMISFERLNLSKFKYRNSDYKVMSLLILPNFLIFGNFNILYSHGKLTYINKT